MKCDIKICGLKTPEAVERVIERGATHVGFIFFPKSPRNIALDVAGELSDMTRGRAKIVAVTVDADDESIDDIVSMVKPDILQLHGRETPQRLLHLKALYGLPIMKALSVKDAQDLQKLDQYVGIADRFLFDAKAPAGSELPGGNGVAFDWKLMAVLDEHVDYMLSGGLNKDNVAAALASTRATADVNHNVKPNSFRSGPDEDGRFGIFGGRFVAETLMPLILDLQGEWEKAKQDEAFLNQLSELGRHYIGRPSPLYFAERLTEHLGGAKIYFKREELNHTGSHKINNCIGQILLAKRMGKTRIIAETGAGQHGVASATVAARFGLPCVVYMGATDVERQAPNVFRMKLLGAEVKPVTSGSGTLKDAMNEALRDWVTNVESTYYLIGTAAGPHPYPEMVRDFQAVIGKEAREQILQAEGKLPDLVIAAVGGGSNAIGIFHPFLDDEAVQIVGVEAGGRGLEGNEHCASITAGSPGVLHGNRTYLLQNTDGQILEGHSISAGLDYPGIGPEHSWLNDIGRAEYVPIMDDEALEAFQLLTRLEGIIPALEPSHAIAEVIKRAPKMGKDQIILMNLSGRGDKDIFTVGKILGMGL
eukprot:g10655.t1